MPKSNGSLFFMSELFALSATFMSELYAMQATFMSEIT